VRIREVHQLEFSTEISIYAGFHE